MNGQDDLIGHARDRAESSGTPSEWGDPLVLEEDGGSFVGRYRGRSLDHTYDPPRDVFLLWDEDGVPCYMRGRIRLVQEFDRAAPEVGDRVAIYRGVDYVTQAGNSGHAYGLESEPCSDPLPAAAAESDIPF
jgi:hypothetical protein